MGELASRSEFVMERGSRKETFGQIIDGRLDSELARQLVSGGFIDRNFTLYTSTFYAERVSATATNFMLKNIDPNIIDMYYELDGDDVEAIVRERGRSVLQEKSVYNIGFLDHLLSSDPNGAKDLVGRLMGYGDDEQSLLAAYFESGHNQERLVEDLAARWPKAFTFLLEVQIEEEQRLKLVDLALQHLSSEVTYELGEPVHQYLEANYSELNAFSHDQADEVVKLASATANAAGVYFPDLGSLHPKMLAEIVKLGAYSISRKNLQLALGGEDQELSLNAIRELDSDIYDRVLADLPAYRASLEGGELAISDPAVFTTVITDVANADEGEIVEIASISSDESIADDLSELPENAWTPLAELKRISSTFANVKVYLDEIGMDTPLGVLLSTAGDINIDDPPIEADKLEVALALIGAKAQIPSAASRAHLTSTLELEAFVAAASVPAETGELVGELISERVISDAASSFALLQPSDWIGLEHAISKSTKFLTFMSPAEIPVEHLGSLIASVKISADVKIAVVARFAEFTVDASPAALMNVADYAIGANLQLPIADVTRLASERVGVSRVLSLLMPLLPGLTLAQLSPILRSLRGEYLKLDGPTGKRPRFNKTSATRALVDHLNSLGIVSRIDDDGSTLRVNMKRA